MTPEPDPTPQPSNGQRTAARRRRLAYLLAAAILAVAGIVTGVIVTRPTPKRHHTVAVPVKPKPKPVTLSTAEFMTRWNHLVAGPSDVATGRVVAYENRFGKILAEKYEAASIAITNPTLWHWVVPHLSPPGAAYGVGRAETTGTATPAGTTITRTWRPNTITLPGGGTMTRTAPPIVAHYAPSGYVVMTHSLPVVRVQRLATAEPLRALVLQRVVSSTRTSWRVQFDEVAATGGQTGQSIQTSPPLHPTPPSQLPPGTVLPVFGPHAPYGASIPLTLTVTPTAAGGLEIKVPNAPLTANPASAS